MRKKNSGWAKSDLTPEALRALRQSAGLTQIALATKMGVPSMHRAICMMEKGKMPITRKMERRIRETISPPTEGDMIKAIMADAKARIQAMFPNMEVGLQYSLTF